MVLLSGRGRLGMAIEQKLREAGARVERFSHSEGAAAITQARLESASVLVLAADDDAGNVDMALTIRRLRPNLPLVVRLFDSALVTYLKTTLDSITVLSMSGMAAPVFADAALRTISNNNAARGGIPSPSSGVGRLYWPRWRPDRVLVTACLSFVCLVVFSSLFFAAVLGLSTFDALYFVWTTIMTVGYGDISLRNASPIVKLTGMMLMFAGAAFMAVLFAFFTGWVVTRRLNILNGRVRVRGHGHVVIAGGGNVGLRVATILHEKEHRVVVIEKEGGSRHIGALRAAGHHVIVADAIGDGMLDLAGIDGASAFLALTDSDAVNLHIALLVRANRPGIPVVMRVVSPELSAHVSEKRDAVAISPVAVAVEEFVRAAMAACGDQAS